MIMAEFLVAVIVFVIGGIVGLIFDSGFSPYCWYALLAYLGIWLFGEFF